MTRDRLPKCSRFSAFEGWGPRWAALQPRRRRHSAHIRWLMTPPPCVIDRSAFLGSQSPLLSRQLLRTRRVCARSCVLSEKAAGCLDLPPQRRYRRAATAGVVERTGAVATCVVLYFKNVPCSSFSARLPAAFLFSSSSCDDFAYLTRIRVQNQRRCRPAAVAGNRRSPAVLRGRSSSGSVRVHPRRHLPTTSTPR